MEAGPQGESVSVASMPGPRVRILGGLRDLEPDLQRIPGRWWTAVVAGTYVVVEAVLLARHVLWRDESQLWLVPRASGSLPELLDNMNYENRPILWFLLIWPMARLCANPDAIKVISLTLSAGVALLVTRLLPLARIEQVVVLGGFLFLIGYGTGNAGYMLGTFLTLVWFVAFSRGRWVIQLCVEALMAATHALFLMVALPLLLLTIMTIARNWRKVGVARRVALLGTAGATIAVFAFSAWLIAPPSDYVYWSRPQIGLDELPGRLLRFAGVATRPPNFEVLVDWNVPLLVLSALPLLLIAVVALSPRRWEVVAPVASLTLLIVNGAIGYSPFWWHTGAVFVTLMLIVLVTREVATTPWFKAPLMWQSMSWWLILAAQVVGTVFLPGSSMLGDPPLSGSKAAAQAITRYCPTKCAVITDDDIVSAGVSAYLGGQPMYHVNTERWATFVRWDHRLRDQKTPTWDMIRSALRTNGPSAVAALSTLRDPPADMEVLSEPTPSVNGAERFLVVRSVG